MRTVRVEWNSSEAIFGWTSKTEDATFDRRSPSATTPLVEMKTSFFFFLLRKSRKRRICTRKQGLGFGESWFSDDLVYSRFQKSQTRSFCMSTIEVETEQNPMLCWWTQRKLVWWNFFRVQKVKHVKTWEPQVFWNSIFVGLWLLMSAVFCTRKGVLERISTVKFHRIKLQKPDRAGSERH